MDKDIDLKSIESKPDNNKLYSKNQMINDHSYIYYVVYLLIQQWRGLVTLLMKIMNSQKILILNYLYHYHLNNNHHQ